ncbi:MAG TPA: hypothetical protein VF395_21590, partial [Polyangiaceae bacterium]
MPARRCRHAWPTCVSLVSLWLLACKEQGPQEAKVQRNHAPAGAVSGTAKQVAPRSGEHGAPGSDPEGPRIQTVFLILLENKAWSEVKGSKDAPYLNGALLPRASIAEGYRA